MKLPGYDGCTLEITHLGAFVDVHVKTDEGRTVATVTMQRAEFLGLLAGSQEGAETRG